MSQSQAAELVVDDAVVPRPKNYLNVETTVVSWLLTTDHKRIGVMFLGLVTLTFLLGGVFAMILRIELLTPGPTIVNALDYNRLFTLHGVVMVWLFLIPSIPSSFGNFMLPIMVGASDVAFPRLNLASVYIYTAGAILMLWGMIQGGADTGWTFYTPYSTMTPTRVAPIALGVFIVGFSTIITGLNFIVTVHTMRAKGMTWFKVPLFVWAIYGTSIIQVLATPVLALVLLLVAAEHLFGFGIFDPARGGDPLLFQHLFWFYSHPAVYIMILPAMGVVSETVSALSRKNSFGYRAIVYSTLGIALVGFFTWGHHMFTTGLGVFDVGAFSVLSMFVGIFTAIKTFNWVGTMYRGSIAFRAPFVYVCGFIYFLVIGGMTGIGLAVTGLDVHWQDTYFVVAHFHFIMVGGSLMAFLAALHYWFPKMFGKMYPERWALAGAIAIIFAFNFTFIPQFLLGNGGMPRRYYEYPAHFQVLHVASTAGASVLALGFLLILGYLIWTLKWGPAAGANPWGSRGFEWRTLSPPPKHNFLTPPVYTHGPHDYYEHQQAEAAGVTYD